MLPLVVEAQKLVAQRRYGGGEHIDPFCTVVLENQHYRTRSVTKTTTPNWKQSFTLYGKAFYLSCLRFVTEEKSTLEVEVYDWHLLVKPGFRGRCEIPVPKDNQKIDQWFRLNSKKGKKEKDLGEIHLIINYYKGY